MVRMATDQPLLEQAVGEIERHVHAGGWDQSTRLYALVDTAELIAGEPQLAQALGVEPDTPAGAALTPVEQEDLPDGPLDATLAGIAWPPEVLGCALVTEVVVLPPGAEEAAPDDADLATWAAGHPLRRDVRLAVGVLRDGSRAARLRLRSDEEAEPDDEDDVLSGPDLAPNLADALLATLED